MDKMKKVYDFEDFKTAVSTASSGNVTVVAMNSNDFYKWKDYSSRAKKISGQHYMHEIVQVTTTRGSFDLMYKKSFSSNEEFSLNVLQEKYKKDGIPCPVQATDDCGISKERKQNILKVSVILKEDKAQFYRNLSVSSVASKGTVTASEPLKSNARQNSVASKAKVAASAQPKSNARQDPIASKAKAAASAQPKSNARRNPVASKAKVTCELTKLNARRNPVASAAKVTASEQLKSNARRNPVASKAEVAASAQPKSNANKLDKKTEEKSRQSKSRVKK